MKLKDIYQLAVKLGMSHDFRGTKNLEALLQKENRKFESMVEEEKAEFDQERISNPYHDTRILHGDIDLKVGGVMAGIDIEVEEILLADQLRDAGRKIDLVISHHPEGKALANLHLVMHAQNDLYHKYGVPVNVAEGVMAERIDEVRRGLAPLNHNRSVDASALLNIPFMCVHSAADHLAGAFIQGLMDKHKPETLKDIIRMLLEIPEYSEMSSCCGVVPTVVEGRESSRAGNILVMMAGGTSGSEKIYEKLAQAGVGTVLLMHIPEKNLKEAKKHHVNVVVAGHMASDSLGMNLFLDELEREGIKITLCSGLLRHSRL